MPDEPQSNGDPVHRGIDEREDRYRLAASQLNIELSLIGSEPTLRETYLLAASRLIVELSRWRDQQTLLEAARIPQRLTAGADRGFDAGRQEYVAGV
jgi:hypothetical protein